MRHWPAAACPVLSTERTTVQQPESLSLEQIQAFLDGCESVSFQLDSRTAKYASRF